MKKLATLICLLSIFSAVQAQYDENARKVLDAMSERYREIPAYSADINWSLINETDGIDEEFNGKITVKGDKYRLELDEQVVINDGTTFWTYLPDVNEVNIDNYNPDEDEISPSKIYDAYKKGYKYVHTGEEALGGEKHEVIDLVPDDKDAQYFKIKLFIKQSDNSLTKWIMFDKMGSQYHYAINNFNASIKPGDDYFVFDPAKYPGVEIIDLR